jgi:hypothetical protein
MIIYGHLLRNIFWTVEGVKVSELGAVPKGQNASRGTVLRKEILGPEHGSAAVFPGPSGLSGTAEAVDEHNTAQVSTSIQHEALTVEAHSTLASCGS